MTKRKTPKKLIICLVLASISFVIGMSVLISAMGHIENYAITPLAAGVSFAGAVVLTGLGVLFANLAFKDPETKMIMTSVSLVWGGILSTMGMLTVKVSNTVFYVTQNYPSDAATLPAWVMSSIHALIFEVVLLVGVMFLSVYAYHRCRRQGK